MDVGKIECFDCEVLEQQLNKVVNSKRELRKLYFGLKDKNDKLQKENEKLKILALHGLKTARFYQQRSNVKEYISIDDYDSFGIRLSYFWQADKYLEEFNKLELASCEENNLPIDKLKKENEKLKEFVSTLIYIPQNGSDMPETALSEMAREFLKGLKTYQKVTNSSNESTMNKEDT